MKKILSLIIIASLALTACQKELNFDTPPTDNGTGDGGSTGDGGNTSTDCKSCIYMPVCEGSWTTYFDTTYNIASLLTDTLKLAKDTTIDGKTFVKTYSPVQKSYTYYNCTDGATRVIAYNQGTLGGNTIYVADLTFIKANLPVGGTWTDNLINPLGEAVSYNSKIAEKGISRTLNGKTFNDVIHVNTETGLNVPGLGFTVTDISDYYFAKGVGLIEAKTIDVIGGTVFEHRVIKAYYIP